MSPIPLPLALPFPQQTASSQPNEADIEPASGSGLSSSSSSAPKSDDGAVKAALFAVGIVLVLALLIYLFCTVDPPAAWLRRLIGRRSDGEQAAKDNNNNSHWRRRGARLEGLASSPLPLPATPPLPPPEYGIRLTNGYSIRREERVGGNADGSGTKLASAGGVGINGKGHHAFQFGFDTSPPSRNATPQSEFAGSGREGLRGAAAPPPPPPRAKTGAGQFSLMAAPSAAGRRAPGAAQV